MIFSKKCCSQTPEDRVYRLEAQTKMDAAYQSVLPACHAVTGCDTEYQFAGHVKLTAWKAFDIISQLLVCKGYVQLKNETVEKFVCKLYDPSTEIT